MKQRLNPAAAHAFLMGRINYERSEKVPRKICLDRMKRLLALLGDPQNELCTVHVAGSKGKGSTTAMIARTLESCGLKTGCFTSPHLVKIEERICVDNRPIESQRFAEVLSQMVPTIEQMDEEALRASDRGPTFFEIVTAAAWLHFLNERIDVAVMEVGLGGRLDSTNVCSPSVTVITTISLDHTHQLGNTLAQIATEKAGILKQEIPLVCGVTDASALAAIQEIADERRCEVILRGRDYTFDVLKNDDQTAGLNYVGARHSVHEIRTAMIGEHQASNAACAIAAVSTLLDRRFSDDRVPQFKLSEAAIRAGLLAARLPARIEVLSMNDPLVIVDGAHNESSIGALVQSLDELAVGRNRRIIFASTRGKDTSTMLQALGNWADELVLTKYIGNPRGVALERLKELVNGLTLSAAVRIEENPDKAWQSVWLSASERDLICVTGSLFLAAELREEMIASLGSGSEPLSTTKRKRVC